jgi:hypothetical protein
MLYVGLDLSRKRLDFHLLDGDGATVEVGASPPDADGLRRLSERVAHHGAPILAAIESMNGARFVHDRLELHGWQVKIADAQKVKGLAPLACKTDRIDARVLAQLSFHDLDKTEPRPRYDWTELGATTVANKQFPTAAALQTRGRYPRARDQLAGRTRIRQKQHCQGALLLLVEAVA